jgi:uncharacterized YccA/Bax inhibitor family protein
MGSVGETSDRVLMVTCKRRLATLWFAASGFLFIVVTVQTILGKYGDQATDAWGWLLPTILPTLSLILGVLVMDARGKMMKVEEVDRFLFDLTLGLSAAYLLMVALTIFVQPLVSAGAIALMKQSKLWLGPFQGLVSGSMGAFFVRRKG